MSRMSRDVTMSKLNYIKKRLEIIQALEKTPTTYIKALLWMIIDSPRTLYKYKVCQYFTSLASRLVQGIKVKLDYGEFVVIDGSSLWILVHYEKPIVKMLKRIFLSNPELIFVDVGAHIGKYTVLAGRYLNKGLVLAFEPHPENFKYLMLNVSINKISNVKLFPLALWNRVGHVKMVIASTSGEHSCKRTSAKATRTSNIINVLAVPLDYIVQQLKLKGIDIIKIDVEGAEVEVLEGAINTLYEFKPHIIVEVWFSNLKRILMLLHKLNYRMMKLDVQQNHVYLYAYPANEKPFFEVDR